MIYSAISLVMFALIAVTILVVLAYCILGFASTIIDAVKFLMRMLKRI